MSQSKRKEIRWKIDAPEYTLRSARNPQSGWIAPFKSPSIESYSTFPLWQLFTAAVHIRITLIPFATARIHNWGCNYAGGMWGENLGLHYWKASTSRSKFHGLFISEWKIKRAPWMRSLINPEGAENNAKAYLQRVNFRKRSPVRWLNSKQRLWTRSIVFSSMSRLSKVFKRDLKRR